MCFKFIKNDAWWDRNVRRLSSVVLLCIGNGVVGEWGRGIGE